MPANLNCLLFQLNFGIELSKFVWSTHVSVGVKSPLNCLAIVAFNLFPVLRLLRQVNIASLVVFDYIQTSLSRPKSTCNSTIGHFNWRYQIFHTFIRTNS